MYWFGEKVQSQVRAHGLGGEGEKRKTEQGPRLGHLAAGGSGRQARQREVSFRFGGGGAPEGQLGQEPKPRAAGWWMSRNRKQ